MINGHGDDIHRYPDIKINFSSNINPVGLNVGLIQHLKGCMGKIASYPEPLAENLAKKIACRHRIGSESVLVTNGAVEAFYTIASLLPQKRSLILVPSFSEYEDACKNYHHRVEYANCSNLEELPDLSDYDSVWIGNPNNPNGKLYNKLELLGIIKKYPDTLFIVDEAYMDFVSENQSVIDHTPTLSNLMVTCSMTKRFSVPGIRLGYLISHPSRIIKLKENMMPWRINALAIECGLYCLSEMYNDNFNIENLLDESIAMQKQIKELGAFTVHPSDTLFFLIQAPIKAAELKQELALNHKILIRDASNFKGLSAYHFRISTRSAKENQTLINALKTWV